MTDEEILALLPVSDRPQQLLAFAYSLIAATREQTLQEAIDLVRRYLVYDTQRAVSWHEIQDTLEALGRIRALTRPPGDEG